MRFDLKKPCSNCPFSKGRSDDPFRRRASGSSRRRFSKKIRHTPCHKTDRGQKKDIQHCAGAMIVLEKLERPNQLGGVAERLGLL